MEYIYGVKDLNSAAQVSTFLKTGKTLSVFLIFLTFVSDISVNSDNLKAQKENGVTKKLVGFELIDRGIPRKDYEIVDAEGNELVGNNVEGNLCVKFPWPSMIRTTYGDHKRCKDTYFSTYPGMYFTGDGAKRDHDGYLRILGRVDDVMNVSGHRMGTAEVENAINEHPKVIESAVVGFPHEIKGQGIYAYVICDMEGRSQESLIEEIKDTVRKIIGPIAKPDQVQIVSGLPKTRSGKIMRRILRKVASKDVTNLGDTSTLLNPEVVNEIIQGANIK